MDDGSGDQGATRCRNDWQIVGQTLKTSAAKQNRRNMSPSFDGGTFAQSISFAALDGSSVHEAAKLVGATDSAVKSQLRRARKKLQHLMRAVRYAADTPPYALLGRSSDREAKHATKHGS